MRKCLFCGRVLHPSRVKNKGKSEEHIIPQWLMDHLGIRRLSVSPMRVHAATRRIMDVRQHQPDAMKSGAVCGACNNGWMSDLEVAVRPILIWLMADPHQLTTLTQDEKTIVARWMFKTVAALNRASTYGDPRNKDARSVPNHHLRLIASGQLPQDVVVVGGGYASQRPLDWLQYAMWSAPQGVPLKENDRERSYKIGIAFRDLVLAVAYYPSAEYRYSGVRTLHIPLWAGKRGIVLFLDELIDATPPKSTSPQLELFLRNLFLVSMTWLTMVANAATFQLIV